MRVHAERLGPAQLAVDGGRVERVGLPHLELVDGGGRGEVAADEPRLGAVPLGRPRFRPAAGRRRRLLRGGGRLRGDGRADGGKQDEDESRHA